MRPNVRPLSLLAAFAFSFGCASPGSSAKSPADVATPAKVAATAPHAGSIFFWRATQKGKPGSVLLLGSIHVRGDKGATLDRAITDAATTCERGAFELDLDAVDQAETVAFVQREGVLEGKTLKDVVKPETYAAWSKTVASEQLPGEMYEKFKPWLASMMLQLGYLEKQGIRGDHGVDKMMYAFEKQEPTRKRTVVGLETALDQLALLQSSSAPIQDQMLRATSLGIDKKEFEKLLAQYGVGDEAGIEDLLTRSRKESPETEAFMEAILDRRNVTMTEKIAPMADTAGCTVVTVGVGHMLGPTGIVHLMEKKGFAVERVAGLGATEPSKMAFTVAAPKLFVSKEGDFEVRSSTVPMRQENDFPGVQGVKLRSYVFADRASSSVTVAAVTLPVAIPAAKRPGLLTEMASGMLAQAGVTPGAAQQTTVAGEQAVRVRGSQGKGPVASGETVALMHGATVYIFVAAEMRGSTPGEASLELDKLLTTFKLR